MAAERTPRSADRPAAKPRPTEDKPASGTARSKPPKAAPAKAPSPAPAKSKAATASREAAAPDAAELSGRAISVRRTPRSSRVADQQPRAANRPPDADRQPPAAIRRPPSAIRRPPIAAQRPTLRIKLVRSPIGNRQRHKNTVRSLGFRRLNQVVEQPDSLQLRGMIFSVKHLVQVVE